MRSNGLIEDDVLDFAFGLADIVAKLVNEKEAKLKLEILVFDKF